MIAKAWVEDGAIKCLSQNCNLHGDICPRFNDCKFFQVELFEIHLCREKEESEVEE